MEDKELILNTKEVLFIIAKLTIEGKQIETNLRNFINRYY